MRKLLTILAVLIATGGTALADTPFLNAMRYVPAETFLVDQGGMVQFADPHTGLRARGIAVPESWEELGDDSVLPALPQNLTPDVLQYLLIGGPDYPALLGLDFFQITATVDFGTPPEQGMLLLGDFDQDLVRDAFLARGYVAADDLLCPATGCDTGAVVDVNNRMPGNPFGGALGRSFPVWSTAGVLAGSPADSVVQQVAAVAADESQSLAGLPEVQALAWMLNQVPSVSSITLVNPLMVSATPEQLTRVANQLAGNPLPPYSLAAFAAGTDAVYDYGLVLLVYPDAELATLASAALDARLARMSSELTGQPYVERLAAGGELASASVVPHQDTGLHVVTIGSRAPKPLDPGTRGGQPYNLLLNGLYMRDALWLVPGG